MTPPDAFALGGIDPLIALIALRNDIEERMKAIDTTLAEPEYNAALAVFYDPINKIEDQIGEAVPTSIAGAVALIRFLQSWQEERENDEYANSIIGNLITGLERLAAEGTT